MNSIVPSLAFPIPRLALAALLLAAGPAGATDPAPPPPRITDILVDSETVFVTVETPAGVGRIVLEACQRHNLRGWLPIAVERLEGDARTVTFRIPILEPYEILRVRADGTDPLPATYYRGRTNIAPVLLSSNSGGTRPISPALDLFQGALSYLTPSGLLADASSVSRAGTESFALTLADPGSPAPSPPASQGAATREVVESDIWNLHGSRLYFFNQRRGLQVIDVAEPSAPALVGTLSLPSAGDQLYVLDDQHVVLLIRDACSEGLVEQGAAVVVDVSAPQPRELSRWPVPGRVVESRLVGTALYVASQTYVPAREDPAAWEWSTLLTALDLADPTAPEPREGRTIAGNATAVAAKGDFLFVAVAMTPQAGVRSTQLQVFDISAEDGTIVDFEDIPLRGTVLDKFKLDLHGDVLRVVVEDLADAGQRSPVTRLLTVQLGTGGEPRHRTLGSLELAAGESLFGTRFDGDRAYVVTYRRVDPLWVVDLSDPTAPRIAGELHIPGWSTYLHPLGDRLLTVGIDDTAGSRAAVQLFDVADPARPALLAKVALGQNWSASEATENEKALSVFPEAGLVLVPFQASGQADLAQGLQLIDLGRDTLTRRGVIAHSELAPRRATLTGNRVLSLSPRELLSVDIGDRDRPAVTAELELAPSVDRLLTVDPYLLKFSDRGLEVAALSQPEAALSRTSLGSLPVLGATIRDQRLFVLQGTPAGSPWTVRLFLSFENGQSTWTGATNDGRLQLTLFDLRQLPDVAPLGQTSTHHSETALPDFKALWPTAETLVWSATTSPAYYPLYSPDFSFRLPLIDAPAIAIGGGGGVTFFEPGLGANLSVSIGNLPGTISFSSGAFNLVWPGPGTSVRQTLFAYDVGDPTLPTLESIRHSSDDAAQASEAFTGDDLVLFSEEIHESEVTGTNFVISAQTEWLTVTNLVWRTNITAVPEIIRRTNILFLEAAFPAITRSWSNPGQPAPLVVAGATHNLLLDGLDTLWTWGDTATRRTADGALRDSATPESVALAAPIVALSAGHRLSLALDSSGSVWSWAAHLESAPPPLPGEPPNPEPLSGPPRIVGGLPPATAISAGSQHALAVAADAAWAWGRNERGQLGDRDPLSIGEPAPVAGLPGEPVSALAAGAFHSLALFADGRVLAWGDNELGQLGGFPGRSPSAPILAFDGAKAIAAGQAHSVALRADGTVWTWGRSGDGRLGRPQENSDSTPQMVPGLPPIRAIAAGGFHTLALAEDGQVWIWGSLDPTVAPVNLPPLPVVLPGPVAAIASGRWHAILVTTDGRTLAWGRNDKGQLGTGEAVRLEVRGPTQQIESEIETRYVTNTVVTTKIERTAVNRLVTNAVPIVRWWQRHQLVALDYAADPADPLIRPRLDLPGALRGVSHNGAMLYTVARRGADGAAVAGRDVLEAAAYDGVAVFVGQGREVADTAAGQTAIVEVTPEGRVVVTRGFADNQTPNRVELLVLDALGGLVLQGHETLAGYPQTQRTVAGLLAIREAGGLELFDLSADGPPRRLPAAGVGCLPLNLDRLAGDATVGLWVPAGEYGAVRLGPQ